MKKLFLLLILIILPFNIKAEEINAKIKVNKVMMNNSLYNNQFTFNLKDLEGNIIQTQKNDSNGNVIFDIKVNNDSNFFKYYMIEEVNDNQIGVTYDTKPIYVSVKINQNDTTAKINYVKSFEKSEVKEYNFFHATEEDLKGQAYAVYDQDEKSLTFFRDEALKYTSNQVIGSKKYYTDLENADFNLYSNGWDHAMREIKTVVFKDAIKPKKINGWFQYMEQVESIDFSKLDTSEVTSFEGFLEDSKILKNVDISTLDTSNVTSFALMFRGSGVESLDFSQWNMDKMTAVDSAVNRMPNLKKLNISNWKVDSSAELAKLPCLEYLTLGNKYRIYRTNIDVSDAAWIKLKDNKVYTTENLRDIAYDNGPEAIEGEYVRPSCTEKVSFINYYKEQDHKNDQEKKEALIVTVPNTGVTKVLLIIVGIVTLMISIIIAKRMI